MGANIKWEQQPGEFSLPISHFSNSTPSMEVPPLSTPPPTTTTPLPHAHTLNSSRKNTNPDKLRLMCSYGGHILPRPHDKTLCYVGGDTRIIVIDRHDSLSQLHHRLSKNLFNNRPFSLKYQLPTEDLDSLITLTSDEDLENMVDEYDRSKNAAAGRRLRLFLFPKSPSSVDQLLVETASTNSEDCFFNALNGYTKAVESDRGFSETSSFNCLLGLEDEFAAKAAVMVMENDIEAQIEESRSAANGNFNVNSFSGSPMLETTSVGSTSSSLNLPSIRVHVEENLKIGALGIEEQFQQMSIGNLNPQNHPHKQEEMGNLVSGTGVSGFPTERSDPIGHRKPHQAQLQTQQIPQFQQNASPDSASSDGNVARSLYLQRQAIHEEPLIQIESGITRVPSNQADLKPLDQSNTSVQMQPQFQYDQNQPQPFIHPVNQAIPYYAAYPPQQQLDQHYPFYLVHPNAPPASLPSQMPYKAEIGNGVYTTTAPQLVQQQYMGFTQIRHASSSPNSTYAYEFADPTHTQMYYTPLPPQLAAQYQMLTSAPENIKQQVRNPQA